MEYLLMTIPICFSVLNSILLRKFKNKTFTTRGDAFLFNAGISVVWIFILLLWTFISGDDAISAEAIIYGIILGTALCLFLYLRTESFAEGPVSLTNLIHCSAFIMATWFGVIYASEKINAFQLIGMGLNIVSLIMCINPKKSKEKLTAKWLAYSIGAMISNGMVGILFKIFGNSGASVQVNTMMLTAAVVSAILLFITGKAVNRISKNVPPKVHKNALPYILLCGISACITIRLNIPLTKILPSAVIFPVTNGAAIALTTLTGSLLFKEKLSKIQKQGIVIGLISIVITGCGNAIWNMFFN